MMMSMINLMMIVTKLIMVIEMTMNDDGFACDDDCDCDDDDDDNINSNINNQPSSKAEKN